MGWDKDSLLISKGRENNSSNNNKRIRKTSDAQCSCSPPADQCTSHRWAAIPAPWPTPPSLYISVTSYGTEYTLWPVWVSCPGYAPSQLLVHLLVSRAREAEKSLT